MGKLWHRKTETAEVYVSTPNEYSDICAQTSTPLAANASWVSRAWDTQGWGLVIATVYSDQPGTLYVEFSQDGTNWDAEENFAYTGGTRLGVLVDVVAPYCRIRYVNGATGQTVFRLTARMRRW